MKIGGVAAVVVLLLLCSMVFTNFGFYSGAGSLSVLIDVNEGKDPGDRTLDANILATSPAFGMLKTEGEYEVSFEGAKTEQIELTEQPSVAAALQRIKPEVIIHCASASDVDWNENHPTLSKAINEASGSMNAIYYPDSHHAFDSIEPVTYVENAITAGERHSYIDKDGNLYFENDSGERFLLNEPEQRLSLFNESKNIKGAHLGVNWELRERSMKDVVDFLLSKI